MKVLRVSVNVNSVRDFVVLVVLSTVEDNIYLVGKGKIGKRLLSIVLVNILDERIKKINLVMNIENLNFKN